MSLDDRVSQLEGQKPRENDTIIPRFRTPDTCVFCTENYDSIFYQVFRLAYNPKKERQDKQTCMHHSNEWLKHSKMSAGFTCSAIMGDKKMNTEEIMEIFKNKKLREELLSKKYNESKNYSTACDLYLPASSGVNTEKRYTTSAFTIEDDIPIQNKIIRNKIKRNYEEALEVLRNFE